MLHQLILIVLLSSASLLYAQPSSRVLIDEGVELHDQGKYKEAIAKYNEALSSDQQCRNVLLFKNRHSS